MTRRAGFTARMGAAAAAAAFASITISSAAFAGGCEISVTPASVAVGQQFTVAGNFGGAEIYLVPGENGVIPEGATPDATTPAGDSFSVVFTTEAADLGDITVWAFIPASECGDSAPLTVVAVSDTSTGDMAPAPSAAGIGLLAFAVLGVGLLGGLVAVVAYRRP